MSSTSQLVRATLSTSMRLPISITVQLIEYQSKLKHPSFCFCTCWWYQQLLMHWLWPWEWLIEASMTSTRSSRSSLDCQYLDSSSWLFPFSSSFIGLKESFVWLFSSSFSGLLFNVSFTLRTVRFQDQPKCLITCWCLYAFLFQLFTQEYQMICQLTKELPSVAVPGYSSCGSMPSSCS